MLVKRRMVGGSYLQSSWWPNLCRAYFWITNEELELEHFSLRPHQEWIGGKFVVDFMVLLLFYISIFLDDFNVMPKIHSSLEVII